MTKIFVTGGNGFIGSAFVRSLLGKNIEVFNLDLLTYAGSEFSVRSVSGEKWYTFSKGDINDSNDIRRALEQADPDYIIHFAAESHVDNSISGPRKFIETNIIGTFNLLEEARKILEKKANLKKIILVSTDEVYGTLGSTGVFDEASPMQPNSPYSSSKASADMLGRSFFQTYGLPVIVTHCSNNYGPFQYPEKLIPVVYSKIIADEKIPIYGTGENVRDWIHVDDHIRGLHSVLDKGFPGEVYNFGGETEVSNIKLVKKICQIMDDVGEKKGGKSEKLVTFIEDRKGHDWRYAISNEKSKRELGWYPEVNFDQGLKDTLMWYWENGESFFASLSSRKNEKA